MIFSWSFRLLGKIKIPGCTWSASWYVNQKLAKQQHEKYGTKFFAQLKIESSIMIVVTTIGWCPFITCSRKF